MGTEIISSNTNNINTVNLTENLEVELENARATLRGVEDNIKKVFGKDPSELNFQRGRRGPVPLGNNDRRSFHEEHQHSGGAGGGDDRRRPSMGGRGILDSNRLGRKVSEDEPMEKRWKSQDNHNSSFGSNHGQRTTPLVIASRIKPRHESDEEETPSFNNYNRHPGSGGGGPGTGFGNREREREREPRRLQSRIVSSVKEKSRDEVLAAQRQDRSGRDRNRRMFGALLGTLHQFKQDETKLKDKEEKRAQIEAKLDEADKQEREAVKKQKQQLIRDRKLKLTEIKRLEIKKRRLEELEEWESTAKHLRNFIRTETKPHIFYIPKVLNPVTECKLEESKMLVEEMITNRRQEVITDLENYEQRSKRYWDSKLNFDSVESEESQPRKRKFSGRVEADPLDENMEDELKELMKGEAYDHDDEGDHEDSFSAHENSISIAHHESEGNGKTEDLEQIENEMDHDIIADIKNDEVVEGESQNHHHGSSSRIKNEESESQSD